jgi:uncharacterized protein (DUF111 family)
MLKKVSRSDGSISFLPEFEACRRVAEKNNCPLKDVYAWVMSLNTKKT